MATLFKDDKGVIRMLDKKCGTPPYASPEVRWLLYELSRFCALEINLVFSTNFPSCTAGVQTAISWPRRRSLGLWHCSRHHAGRMYASKSRLILGLQTIACSSLSPLCPRRHPGLAWPEPLTSSREYASWVAGHRSHQPWLRIQTKAPAAMGESTTLYLFQRVLSEILLVP